MVEQQTITVANEPEVVEVHSGPAGPQGPAGPVGPQGEIGPPGYGKNSVIELNASNDILSEIITNDDGTPTGGWPNKFEFKFRLPGGSPRLVAWFNEYGELRLTSAKHNTTAMRIFTREFSSDTVHQSSSYVLEVQNDRNNRDTLFGVRGDGRTDINAGLKIQGEITVGTSTQPAGLVVAWPTGAEPPLTGVPDNTLWVEYAP